MPRAFCPPKNAPEKDIVMTPVYLAKNIIEHFEPTGLILDPCRGEGAFYDNYNTDNKDWCELGEGNDFLEYNKKVDWNDVEQEYQDEIDIINQKLRNLDKCCTCQEDGLDYEQDYLTP